MPVSTWAAQRRQELEKDPQVKMDSVLGVPYDAALERELHAGLKKAQRLHRKGSLGSAWKQAGLKLDDEDPRLVADAAYLRERCEVCAEWKALRCAARHRHR